MIWRYDLSSLPWKLTGVTPYLWKLSSLIDIAANQTMEVPSIPARVPGSVQSALREAGLLPNWDSGLEARACEWVENRQWIYETDLPEGLPVEGHACRLVCQGLDDRGWIYLNGQEVGQFKGAHIPYSFDLEPAMKTSGNRLQIIFDLPPRWLGQFGYTSRMTEWKPRFYYTWDWVSRMVQIGISDSIALELSDGIEIGGLDVASRFDPALNLGEVRIACQAVGAKGITLEVSLFDGEIALAHLNVPLESAMTHNIHWDALKVQPWWPNGMGSQKLYRLSCRLVDASGQAVDQAERRLGFKGVDWRPCEGAPKGADPWLCVVNQRPVFLQGVNWTPIRPNFADVIADDYRQRLTLYRDLGVNILRVWGGATLEREVFYDLCDELGILVWQEFPLSSSGVDNWPPDDSESIRTLSQVAISYLERRKHHACLLMWGGGNELVGGLEGAQVERGKPVDLNHPLIHAFAEITASRDPEHRFVATSSSGPLFAALRENFGKGLHWDVHGPWKADPDLEVWRRYWQDVDALFHSEVGAPGASPADIIRETCGGENPLPVDETNPIWRRQSWWIEAGLFEGEKGRPPTTLEEYVDWSQARQAEALAIVASERKARFPRVGGVIFWMGHDCFPCAANTSIVDFWGRPKPAALALAKIFKSS